MALPTPIPHTQALARAHTTAYVHTVSDIDYNSHHSLQSKSHDLGPNAVMGSLPLPAVCFFQLLLLLHAVFKSMCKIQRVLEPKDSVRKTDRFVTVF